MFQLWKQNPATTYGIQTFNPGAAGPSGFDDGTAGAIQPRPYMTSFIQFVRGFPYGAANTLAAPQPWPYPSSTTGALIYTAVTKQPTGPTIVF